MSHEVNDEEYRKIDGLMLEIKRQIRQKSGYGHDSRHLIEALKDIAAGKLGPAISRRSSSPCATDRFQVEMDWNLTPDELLKMWLEAGSLRETVRLKRIQKTPSHGKGMLMVELVDPERLGLDALLAKYELESRRAATLEEYLTFLIQWEKDIPSHIIPTCLQQIGWEGMPILRRSASGNGMTRIRLFPYSSIRNDKRFRALVVKT